MTIRGLAALATVACALLTAACGAGSGRQGTDLVVTGVGPTAAVQGGQSAVFRMTVTNAGSYQANNVTIVNLVGNQLALMSVECTAAGGAVCPDVPSVSMAVPALPAGGSLTFDVTTQLSQGASGTVSNTMSVNFEAETERTNNSFTVSVSAFTITSNLVVSGTGPTDVVAGGGTASFQMTVRNDGPDMATGLHFVENVGSFLIVDGITCTATGGAVCPAVLGVTMDLDSLPAGGALTFDVRTVVANGVNGTVTNTLQVTADTDINRTDNAFTATATVFTSTSALAVTGVGPINVAAGGSASFAMTVTNTGPQDAASVHLVNTLGGNLTMTSIGCTASGGAICPAVGLVMDVANLPIGGALVFNVTATVAPGTHGSIINTLDATVTSGVRSQVTAVAVGSAYSTNVSVTGTAPAGPLSGGAAGSFAMVVSNSGPGTALDVSITNVISVGLNLLGNMTCVAGGGAVCPAAPAATMVAPSMPPGGFLNFSVPVVVDAGTNGTVGNTMTAIAAGDARVTDNSATATFSAVSVDLGVSNSGAAQVSAGSTAVFTALVSNPGPSIASNLTLTHNLGGAGAVGTAATIVCTASIGASCPATTGPVMTVPSLAVGRTLTFVITVPVPSTGRGDIVSAFGVTADGDPNPANNSASVTTKAVDPRNGSYKAFAADGREYALTIDFDARSYAVVGAGTSFTRTFVPDVAGLEYSVAGTSRFRVATDLLVGNDDFGTGILPYVAARNFGASVSELGGLYNLATRNSATGAAPVTRAATARVSGNVMQVCQSDTAVSTPQSCPPAALKSYTLVVSGGVYTGAEISTGELYSFRLARTGASAMLLSAGIAPDGSRQLRIGLPDASALAGGVVSGGSTSGDWVTIALQTADYAVTGVLGGSDSAALSRLSAGGPFAMLFGVTAVGGQPIYVMQASPLVVVVGGFGSGASGLLQVAVP